MYGVSSRRMLQAYFLGAASIFEPDRAVERLGWARTAVLAEAVSLHFRFSACGDRMRDSFIANLRSKNRCNTMERFVQFTEFAGEKRIKLLLTMNLFY